MRPLWMLAVLSGALGLGATLSPAQAQAPRWYKGNTHAHTINTDGDSSPDTVARWYKEHGYQFLFLTDHEYLVDVAPLNALFGAADRFLVLPGQEITQISDDPKRFSAHINNLFARDLIFPVGTRKCIPTACGTFAPADMPLGRTFEANIAAVRTQQGIAQVNHPNFLWSVTPQDLDGVPDGTLIEIWNGQGGINNLGGDDGKGDVRPSAEGYWDHVLSRGRIMWGVGSDDSHYFQGDKGGDPRLAAGGQAWIMVRAAELTPAAIKAAIEAGDFYASTGVTLDTITAEGDALTLAIRNPGAGTARYSTRFIGQGGKLLAEVAGEHPSYRFRGNETYVRAAVIDSNGKRAWTQPVFRDGRGK